jgi:hypothetical protein
MFSIAREMTRRNITDDELMREMLEAMDLLEKNFRQSNSSAEIDPILNRLADAQQSWQA